MTGRIRTIKPDLTMDEELATLGFAARYFFINLWCHCDREGRCEDRPKMLQAKILPWDKKVDADTLLSELHPKFVLRYSVDGKRYLWIRTFLKHQRPHLREVPSIIPEPPESEKHNLGSAQAQPRQCEHDNLGSAEGKGREGKGMEKGNGEGEGNGIPPKSPKGDFLSEHIGATPEKSYKCLTSEARVIVAYKVALGFEFNDREWDKDNFKRCIRAAGKLRRAFGSDEEAGEWLIAYGEGMKSKGFDWKIDAAADAAWRTKPEREHEKTKERRT